MNRTVIGLNLKFFIHSIVATLLMFTGLFLPYASINDGRKNILSIALSLT